MNVGADEQERDQRSSDLGETAIDVEASSMNANVGILPAIPKDRGQ